MSALQREIERPAGLMLPARRGALEMSCVL